jgi:hypothetical protein
MGKRKEVDSPLKRCKTAKCPCTECKGEHEKDYKTISAHIEKNGVMNVVNNVYNVCLPDLTLRHHA